MKKQLLWFICFVGFLVASFYFWLIVAMLLFIASPSGNEGEIINFFLKFITTDIGVGVCIISILPFSFFLKIAIKNENQWQKNFLKK